MSENIPGGMSEDLPNLMAENMSNGIPNGDAK